MCARLVASRRCCFPKPPAYRNSKNQKHTHGAALIMMLACCSVVARQAPLTSSAHVLKLNAAGKRASSASSPPGFGGKAGRKANVISIASPRFFKTDSEHHQHHRRQLARKASVVIAFLIAGYLETSGDDADDALRPLRETEGRRS